MVGENANVPRLASIGLRPLGDGVVDATLPETRGGPVDAFGDIVSVTRARTVVEVGSWEGRSALIWARWLSVQHNDWLLVCVDTWLGSMEMWERESGAWSREFLRIRDGFPSVFSVFSSNVRRAGWHNNTIAVPIDSNQALVLLTRTGVRADIVYVDAAHNYTSVLRDIRRARALLDADSADAVILCDDFMPMWPGVREAIFASALEGANRVVVKDCQAALIAADNETQIQSLISLGWHEVAGDDASTTDADVDSSRVERLTLELRDSRGAEIHLRSVLRRERDELVRLRSELRSSRSRQKQLREARLVLVKKYRLSATRFDDVRAQLDDVHSSRSWRWTAWLRRARSVLRARARE